MIVNSRASGGNFHKISLSRASCEADNHREGIDWWQSRFRTAESLEVPMSDPRPRITIAAAVLAAGLAILAPSFSAQAQHPSAPAVVPRPSPNAPNPNFPPGLHGPGLTEPDPKAVDKQNQAELQSDVDRLYALAFELRERMKMTDSTSTMSVTIIKQAQQIEKLAKQIKDRAKR
jgi:hypothetical protein